MEQSFRCLLGTLLACHLVPHAVLGCSIVGDPRDGFDLCREADAIVMGVPTHYEESPRYAEDGRWQWGTIVFDVKEVLLGDVPPTLLIEGELTSHDTSNDRSPPYDFIRPDGREGSCYARRYRGGARFLLFLREGPSGLTPYWAPLAPANEQLSVWADDPWLHWVRENCDRVRE